MRKSVASAAAVLIALSAACEKEPLGSNPGLKAQFEILPNTSFPGGNLLPERVIVCKEYTGAPAGSTADFTVTSTRSDLNLFLPAVSLTSLQCQSVAQAAGAIYDVTVTETAKPGFVLDSIVRYNGHFQFPAAAPFVLVALDKEKLTIGNSATAQGSGNVGGVLRGGLIIFYNSVEPPPPPEGGQGCTPGYWKQKHHFGSWTLPYTPSTQFSAVFSNAFPGMTLLQVLGQGGGGLKALGRHTVAALLNSASASVDYDVTTAGVISAFNAAYASGDYSPLHNQFEAFNEQGCPLGRAE